jgi:hypothetical protein
VAQRDSAWTNIAEHVLQNAAIKKWTAAACCAALLCANVSHCRSLMMTMLLLPVAAVCCCLLPPSQNFAVSLHFGKLALMFLFAASL